MGILGVLGHRIWPVVVLNMCLLLTPKLLLAAPIINTGTSAWADAARTGRADMLVIGDSVTWLGGHGWDAGLIRGGYDTFGLAGTGLDNGGFNGQGEGYQQGGVGFGGWSTSVDDVPLDRRGFRWRPTVSAGDTPRASLGFGISGSTLDPTAEYDWHLWTASPAGGGEMGAYRRLGQPPWTRTATIAPVATQTPGKGLQHTVFHFDARTTNLGVKNEFRLEKTTNTSVFYSRLLSPGATGVTVSSWGYGGKSLLDFYNDRYIGGSMTQEGRVGWLRAMVDGGSGKLNVLIGEGFNDRNETSTSLSGITDGDSPEAFADNMAGLIAAIRSDWQAAGFTAGDLSFTLLGMYEAGTANDKLRGYASELHDMALADQQLSFIDLFELAPSFPQADALGYMQDNVHPTRDGSLFYGGLVMEQLAVPEPSSLFALMGLGMGVAFRQKSQIR